jgi:hypothetical protein
MTFKLTMVPLIAAAIFTFASNEKPMHTTQPGKKVVAVKRLPGTPTVTNLMAGQTTVAGSVTVVDDRDLGTLTITYQVNAGWSLKEVHLYAGTLSGIPIAGNGNPRPGQFPYKKTNFASGIQTWSISIPLSSLPPDEVTIAAHAVVCNTTTGATETGWGQGAQINDGGSWAMRFSHVYDAN